jgi:Protein of unknown function (DUF3311)
MTGKKPHAGKLRYWPRLLFIIPFAAIMWVPSYNRIEPKLAGTPFFHWYQLAWILLGAAIVFIVYVIERRTAKRTAKSDDGLDVTGAPGDIL